MAESHPEIEDGEQSELPYHLRMDAPALAECTDCHRQTWDVDEVGRACGMRQPNGSVCAGTFPYAR